jgi:ABC-type antimicrobial peptide transport system permease subunit
MSMHSAFAVVAVLLAALGIYGVLSFAVAQRTRELAVRTALGARRAQLVGLVLRAGLKVAAVGMAFGIAASTWLARTIESLLVGVRPFDVATYAVAAVVLSVVVVAAILIPSVRATRMDPVIALHAD